MTRYYLGVRVVPITRFPDEPGWVWAMWPDGRCFKHWMAQLESSPWGIG